MESFCGLLFVDGAAAYDEVEWWRLLGAVFQKFSRGVMILVSM